MDNEPPVFKPRARLILQLGDQLIKNESIAFLELIKNSYDACAQNVTIDMQNVDSKEDGVIVIEDDGHGMDIDILSNVWMEPGSDYKERLLKKINPECPRIPLGEKGIGRFAAHKLGNEIELVSRKKGKKEVYCSINWLDFKGSKYLKDVPVNFFEREPLVFKNSHGTRITIKKFNNPWTRGMIREVYRSVQSFRSPSFTEDDTENEKEQIKEKNTKKPLWTFDIHLNIDKQEWIFDLLTWEDIKEKALFRFKCEIIGKIKSEDETINEISRFYYRFKPWPEMKKLDERIITENNLAFSLHKELEKLDKDDKTSLFDHKVGKIRFEGFIFDRDNTVMSLGIHKDRKGFKDFLNQNGGIRVYRDEMRIYDYGEPGNDWLNLGIRRINRLGDKISNNIIIGAVFLDRAESPDLIEKTNREGFVENPAAEKFREAILKTLEVIEIFRNEDKEKIRIFYGPKGKSEPIKYSLDTLRNLTEKVSDTPIKKEMLQYITKIEKDYSRINEILLKSAGAARNLSMVIHEIDKNIDQIIQAIKNQNDNETLLNLTKKLSDLVEGYTILIKKTRMQDVKIDEIIDNAIKNMDFRLKAHKIEVIKSIDPKLALFEVKCNRSLLISSIMNLIDNSIYWLERFRKEGKKIFISVSEEEPGLITVIVADNGPGFTLPTELITEPFVTGKPDGMGLGLFIVDKVMEDHNGKLIFPDWADFTIPEEFKKGAIVGLSFKNSKENQ